MTRVAQDEVRERGAPWLDELWERHREAVVARARSVEVALVALSTGSLDEDLRAVAVFDAHSLAGSLDMFGAGMGSDLAREAENLLRSPSPAHDCAPDLLPRVRALRKRLDGGGRHDDGRTPDGGPGREPAGADALPRAAVSPDRGAEVVARRGPPARGALGRGALLLVSDGDPCWYGPLRDAVKAQGCAVKTAGSLAEAVVAAGKDGLAGIVLDPAAPGPRPLIHALLAAVVATGDDVPVVVLGPVDASERVALARYGARFLPATAGADRVIAAVADAAIETVETTRTVLALDDNPPVLDALRELLTPQGMKVVTIDDPSALWEALDAEQPDLLLLDLNLPGVDGRDLCRALRADVRYEDLPIVVLTAAGDDSTLRQAFAAGADDFVAKARIHAELVTRVLSRLEREGRRRNIAATDVLTGLANRRKVEEDLDLLLRVADREGVPLTVAILDLDRFKSVNDEHGHEAGDVVLSTVARVLGETFRGSDVVGRWGGEEFVVALFGTAGVAAVERMEAVLGMVRRREVTLADRVCLSVSFSAGLAEFPADGRDLAALLSVADERLYAAKAAGRSRVLGRCTPVV